MMGRASLGFVGLTLRSLVGGKRAWAAACLVLLPPLFAGLAGGYLFAREGGLHAGDWRPLPDAAPAEART